jgi:Fe-S cluster assembly iron-binding protein IscA
LASSVDIVPSLGQGLSFLQEGPGISPGYGAIDRRRMLVAAGAREGVVHEDAYKVSAAGTGMTVLVDADAGMVNVQVDSVPFQGLYTIAPHSGNITLDIAAAHATLPRNDLVVLDALDDDHDSSGLNKARVRVLTGTPTSGAVLADAPGAHGTPTLFSNQFLLALVNVPAADTVITTAQVDDRRVSAQPPIDTAGLADNAVTAAKLAAIPQARARRTTTISSVTHGGIATFPTVVTFDTEVFDNDAIFAASSTDLVCKTAGLYLLDATVDVSFGSSTGDFSAEIQVLRSAAEIFHARNGEQPNDTGLSNDVGLPIAVTYRLAVNDVVRLRLGRNGSSSPTYSNLSLGISFLSR